MHSYRKVIPLRVKKRMAFINITPQVQEALRESRIREGLCLVNAMHITASVFINDDEPGLHEHYARWLEQLAPYDPSPQRYHHNRTGEDNADAHHKRQVMGREVVGLTAPDPAPKGSRGHRGDSQCRDPTAAVALCPKLCPRRSTQCHLSAPAAA
jgi:secondary thiamine-phosphate synthase enzyme